jgi:hypothetical protein
MLKAIGYSEKIEFYERFSSYALVHGAKVPSFEEFFGLPYEEKNTYAFDPKAADAMEKRALQLLEERKKAALLRHGG